jgi:hypothetical protein
MDRSEENWKLAGSIRPVPIDDGLSAGRNGVIVAARHPTGWFIWAGFDAKLRSEQIDDFTHFVLVRTYLLLEYGPGPAAWVSAGDGEWRAWCASPTARTEDLPLYG